MRTPHLATALRSATAHATTTLARNRPAPLSRRALILTAALTLASPMAAGGALAATSTPPHPPALQAAAAPQAGTGPDQALRQARAAQARLQRRQARHRYAAHQARLRRERAAQIAAQAATSAQAAASSAAAAAPASTQPAPAPSTTTPAPEPAPTPSSTPPTPTPTPVPVPGGVLSAAQVGALWVAAGGPASAEVQAETISYCESGDNPQAVNASSGATGLFQILGQVVPGNLFDPAVNAANAVAKYTAAGGWSPWSCPP